MKMSHLIPLCLSALLGVATGASAQGGGFNAGELFVYNGVQSPGYTGWGILRVDPVTGASSVFVETSGVYAGQGAPMAFDPYRQRLVFGAPIGGTQNHLWFADGAGNLQNVTSAQYPVGIYVHSLAPTQDGRIYCRLDANSPTPLLYFDAANILRVLYDSDGVTPMTIDGNNNYPIYGMIHEAATNSLFVASTQPAPGFPAWAVTVRKLPLSADGSRVVGPVGNTQFEVSPNQWPWTSGETPRGWSHGPNGQLVLSILSVDSQIMPRMLLVDPVTSAISVWGSNGESDPAPASSPFPWGETSAGAYSSALNQVVVADAFNAKLRGYAQGSTGGPGNQLTTSPASMGSMLNQMCIASVPPDECTGGWIAYGLGLKGAGNVVPKLTGAGCPEPGAPITLDLSDAVGGANAALFVSLAKGALPFKGGTFHLGSVLLTISLPLGGAPGVAGAGSVSLPAFLPNDPGLIGLGVLLQAACSDAAAVQDVSLTQGLELAIG